MQIELAPTNSDIIIDNVSVKKLPRICGDGLIRNGIFDENSKFWKRYGSVHLDIESLPNKNLKVLKHNSNWEGIKQDLYIDKNCGLQPKQRFHVTGNIALILNSQHLIQNILFYACVTIRLPSLMCKLCNSKI